MFHFLTTGIKSSHSSHGVCILWGVRAVIVVYVYIVGGGLL
jgi:hypothetical protein